ncbi:cystatin-like fold lipoprotein [Bacillus cereus group sp. TH204-1LC]|uniref:cystatin-like fold lipoprotein n=1 Tax=Bacillus TaxID=1386 RepID=UPI002079FE62|nr:MULTISPECIES: cystatin-like fold lipoprotein [Bacillus cereus group]MDA1618956.1 cystatin-like fold lipoprotein [Bacillus cereus group sp. TH204-1LC]USL00879.1 cystatin-like fold lipoprotein [Bacillus anthracis]
MRKLKILLCVLTVIVTLFACESGKEKYDKNINQVIKLENEAHLKHGEGSLKRKNTQIIVYEDGKYIELIYNTSSGDKVERVYRLNKDETYEEIKEVGKELDYKKTDYTENVGLK